MIEFPQYIKMAGIYARFKSYAVRSGPYLYDYRFMIAGFCITGYGVLKIVNAAKNKSKLLRKFRNASLEDGIIVSGFGPGCIFLGVINR